MDTRSATHAATTAYDLHTHSTASDGTLRPGDLVRQARESGLTTLALTDHDGTSGLAEARQAAVDCGIRLIPGIELSVTWQEKSIHIVGLQIDPECAALKQGIQRLAGIRRERADAIGRRLLGEGIVGAFEAVRAGAGDGMITRMHFARHLVEVNAAKTVREAFDRFLGRGKPGYVSTRWPDLEEGIDWIRSAGGIPVLAHPLRYRLTGAWMRRLLEAFKAAGGTAIEVISGSTSADRIHLSAEYARRFALLASVGSDFHDPGNAWIQLGALPRLPLNLNPVWTLWES